MSKTILTNVGIVLIFIESAFISSLAYTGIQIDSLYIKNSETGYDILYPHSLIISTEGSSLFPIRIYLTSNMSHTVVAELYLQKLDIFIRTDKFDYSDGIFSKEQVIDKGFSSIEIDADKGWSLKKSWNRMVVVVVAYDPKGNIIEKTRTFLDIEVRSASDFRTSIYKGKEAQKELTERFENPLKWWLIFIGVVGSLILVCLKYKRL